MLIVSVHLCLFRLSVSLNLNGTYDSEYVKICKKQLIEHFKGTYMPFLCKSSGGTSNTDITKDPL